MSRPYVYEGWIETATGGRFDLDDPVFEIKDIAHSLGQIARYNGHAKVFYSVAEHSVLASVLMEKLKLGDPFEGLMHDATEAYLSDVPAPFKQFLPDWRKIDRRVELLLREHFDLEPTKSSGCKKADWLALFIESYDLMPSKGKIFSDPDLMRSVALDLLPEHRVHGHLPEEASDRFMKRYRQLIKRRS